MGRTGSFQCPMLTSHRLSASCSLVQVSHDSTLPSVTLPSQSCVNLAIIVAEEVACSYTRGAGKVPICSVQQGMGLGRTLQLGPRGPRVYPSPPSGCHQAQTQRRLASRFGQWLICPGCPASRHGARRCPSVLDEPVNRRRAATATPNNIAGICSARLLIAESCLFAFARDLLAWFAFPCGTGHTSAILKM